MNPEPDLDGARAGNEPGVCVRMEASGLNAGRFDVLLLESIDEALFDLLGRRAREAIYDYLERRRYMARDEIPSRLGDFCKVLETTFGRGGHTIEKAIAKRLYFKLEKTFTDHPSYTLIDYVEKATHPLHQAINIPITTTTVTTYVVPSTTDWI